MRATSILIILAVGVFLGALAMRQPALESTAIFVAICLLATRVLSDLLKKPE